jgi:hypothetical protein
MIRTRYALLLAASSNAALGGCGAGEPPAAPAIETSADADFMFGATAYTFVGAIPGDAEGIAAADALERWLFDTTGIEALVEGSLAYGVAVPTREVARARAALRDSRFAKYLRP